MNIRLLFTRRSKFREEKNAITNQNNKLRSQSMALKERPGIKQEPVINTSSTGTDDIFNCKTKSLPKNFAEDVLNLEMELENDHVEIKTVNMLLELYAAGVEYYESIKSEKYLIFKKKMQSLWVRPNVIEAMNRAASVNQKEKVVVTKEKKNTKEVEQKPEIVENKKEDMERNQKKKEVELNLMYARQTDGKKDAKAMMTKNHEELEKIDRLIEEEIQEQASSILKRLEQRKMAKLERVSSLPPQRVPLSDVDSNRYKDAEAKEREAKPPVEVINEEKLVSSPRILKLKDSNLGAFRKSCDLPSFINKLKGVEKKNSDEKRSSFNGCIPVDKDFNVKRVLFSDANSEKENERGLFAVRGRKKSINKEELTLSKRYQHKLQEEDEEETDEKTRNYLKEIANLERSLSDKPNQNQGLLITKVISKLKIEMEEHKKRIGIC